MAVNTMDINQMATVLSDIVSQAKGATVPAPVNTAEFVSVAKIGLETGYDKLSTAVSQVLSRTIFSVRPYRRRFKVVEADEMRYGNHVRKINYVDKGFEEDDRIKLVDGKSVDMQKVNKPKVIQTNWYGEEMYMRTNTIYRDQLDTSFGGFEEFARFVSGQLQNIQDTIEQAHENTGRMVVNNLIGGYLVSNAGAPNRSVIHLLSEYNAQTGEAITYDTIFSPDVFPDFARWLFGRLATLSKAMRERTVLYHLPFQDGDVARHTPAREQRLVIMAKDMDQIDARVLSTTFNSGYLKMIPREETMFWQNPQDPMALKLTASYMTPAGAIATGAVDTNKVFGVLFDKEAAGYTVVNRWSAPSPFNSFGGYQNTAYHFTDRYWNDFSENCFVLMLD